MNRFMLSRTPEGCAEALCDVHLRKMIVEEAQMLSTAHWIASKDEDIPDNIYKAAYVNHPCSKWVRDTMANYNFGWRLLSSMVDEYEYRFDKLHATKALVDRLSPVPTYTKLTTFETDHPLCMPDEYQYFSIDDDPLVIESYRAYYIGKLRKWAKSGKTDITYTNREVPAWLQLEVSLM